MSLKRVTVNGEEVGFTWGAATGMCTLDEARTFGPDDELGLFYTYDEKEEGSDDQH